MAMRRDAIELGYEKEEDGGYGTRNRLLCEGLFMRGNCDADQT